MSNTDVDQPSWQDASEARIERVFQRLKGKRVQMFVDELQPGPDDLVLDLGSEDGSYLSQYYPYPHNIVIADIREEPMREGVRKHGLNSYRVIPASGPLPFADGEFKAVWCNSVIEHVTVPKEELPHVASADFARRADQHQREFAAEIERISQGYFVQTPNIHFPVESHTIMPSIVAYLPHQARFKLGRFMHSFWVKQWYSDFYLYNEKRFASHFPNATGILKETAFGLTKSLIAVRKQG